MRCNYRKAFPQGYSIGCGLTIHSSRSRFAARLNSGVRPAPKSQVVRHRANPIGDICLLRDPHMHRAEIGLFRFKHHVTAWVKERTGKPSKVVVPTAIPMIERVLCPDAPVPIEFSPRQDSLSNHGHTLLVYWIRRNLACNYCNSPDYFLLYPRPGSAAAGLTIHSSRSRFAARLNSGVRPQQIKSVKSGFKRAPALRVFVQIPSAGSR